MGRPHLWDLPGIRAKGGEFMKLIIYLAALSLLTGCGIKTQVVRVNVPDVHVNPEHGPVAVVGAVVDKRSSPLLSKIPAADRQKHVGGMFRGGNGINVALESSTTTEKVRAIIVQALRSMGYRTANECDVPCIRLDVSLTEFSVKMPFEFWRTVGWAQQMVADVSTEVVVQDAGQTRTFDVSGHGTNIYQVVSRENWEVALDRAVEDFSSNFKQAVAEQDYDSAGERDHHTSP